MTESNTFKCLFTPVKVGKLELKNRIIMAPTLERLSVNQSVTQAVKDFYAPRARGGASLLVLSPGLMDVTGGEDYQLGIYDDRFIPGLSELTEVIHANGALVGIQLLHYGSVNVAGSRGSNRGELVAASPVALTPGMGVPRELSGEEIDRIIEGYTEAARRAMDAGFDLVEIHAAHGNLLAGFLSPYTNKRGDDYGGDTAGRARIVVQIIRRIRERLGDFPLSCRINGTDYIPGGLTLEEAAVIAGLVEEAGADLISVSAGMLISYPQIIPTFDFPHGCFAHLAEGVKSAVKVPVAAAGRINDPWVAEEILASGKADVIAMGRGLIADPDLPKKALMGKFREIRKCIACNVCTDALPAPITCTVNPEAGREGEVQISRSSRPKRVLVVGGGLAGLEAARVAALRGHEVSLYEEDEEIGGQWILAATPPHKQEHREVINHLSWELEKLGVRINTCSKVTAPMIEKLQPEVVIVATGGMPQVPPIPGVEREEVITAWDVLRGHKVGNRVLVIGGGTTGLETAEFLHEQGKKVVVVEQLKRAGMDIGFTARWHMMHRLRELKLEILTSTLVKEIGRQKVIIARDGREETLEGVDTVVLAAGVRSRNELVKQIEGKVKEVYVIGDAAKPRKGVEALREGAETGRRI